MAFHTFFISIVICVSAVSSGGDDVILFGVPCEYPMSDGSASLAIVVGLSSKYMGEVLFLDSDSSLIYSYSAVR